MDHHIALLRVVLPGRPVLSKDDYRQIGLDSSYLWLSKPGKSKNITKTSVWPHSSDMIYIKPKYVTGLLSIDKVMAIKLMASGRNIKSREKVIDCAIFTTKKEDYEDFLLSVKRLDEEKESEIEFLDFEELKEHVSKAKYLIDQKGDLKKISYHLNQSRYLAQHPIRSHKLKIRNCEKQVMSYFESVFEIESIINF